MTTANDLYRAAKAITDGGEPLERDYNEGLAPDSCFYCFANLEYGEPHQEDCKWTSLTRAVAAYQPLRWSKELPEIDGWYWYRDKHGVSIAYFVSSNTCPWGAEEWAGPIEMPEPMEE